MQTIYSGDASAQKQNGAKLGFTRRELSEATGMSIRSLARAEKRGLIRALKIWRKKVYPHAEVERFLKEGV